MKNGKIKSWFRMQAGANGAPAEILIYDEIGAWGISAKEFDRELKALGAPSEITLRINSPGGDVFDGLAIFNMLSAHPARITAKVDGIAASAASLITMAADKIVAPENAFMLVHEPSGLTIGTAADHLQMATDLENMTASFAGIYAARAKTEPSAMAKLMGEDNGHGRLLTAAQAKEHGLVDELLQTASLSASFALDKIPQRDRPAVAAVLTQAAEETQAVVEVAAESAASKDTIVEPVRVPAVVITEVTEVVAAVAYGADEMRATLDLVAIAKQPLALAQRFIEEKAPLAKVREELAALAAQRSDALEVRPAASTDSIDPAQSHLAEWKVAQARVKAELGIGRRRAA